MRHVAQNDDQGVDLTKAAGLTKAGLAELLRALVESQHKRIASATVDGKRVWIKRYDADSRGVAKWLHAALTPVILHPFLRSSPWLTPQAQLKRELRKSAAFRAAGFPTPDVYYTQGAVMVTAHCEPLAAHQLKKLALNPAEHDALLVDCAATLGRAHAAGLCHGRPHPRDMFLTGDKIGFLDFEEEPEAAMPLPVAQARDAWLLMQQIAGKTLTPGADRAALEAWRRHAPAAAAAELQKAVRQFTPVTMLLSGMAKIMPLASDAQRIHKAGLLLRETLAFNQNGANPAPNGKSAP